MSLPTLQQPKHYISRLARKRMEAARVREQLASKRQQQLLADNRHRRSLRPPMQKPVVIREHLEGGVAYTLLDWVTGKRVGKFAGEAER